MAAFFSETLTDWGHIQKYCQRAWLFRGQRCDKWELRTSLERCWERLKIKSNLRNDFELRIIREFKRAYHQYAQHIPSSDNIIEWLSLMQHHGAPTRLLDFTYSIYVAAYFAIEYAEKGSSVVW